MPVPIVTGALGAPEAAQRSADAVDRVGLRDRHLRNMGQRLACSPLLPRQRS